ncbi:hypothetical protein GGI03_002477 [Coemansia sp. RSA 2337]|nr:hypothetical protein GGI03_002477 [Coemansia sp. RSA 2337]
MVLLTSSFRLLAWLAASGVVCAQQTAAGRPMNSFTPIRLIQPQNSEQQRAIQSLVQELQKSSPQLFSNIGQPGNQQLALALPMNPLGSFGPSTVIAPASQAPAPAPAPAPSPMPAIPSPPFPSPLAAATPPVQPGFVSSALPVLPPVFSPAAAVPLPSTTSIDIVMSTPFSFAINAMFRSTDDASATPTTTGSLPFGLHFDTTLSIVNAWSSDDSDSQSETSSTLTHISTRTRHLTHNNSHKTANEHSSAVNSDIEEELSGLENAASKSPMSLVAVVATSLLAIVALV